MKRRLLMAFIFTVLLSTNIGSRAQSPQISTSHNPVGTAFTYQGQLKEDSQLVNSLCDFQFGLWDSPSGGVQLGITQTHPNVSLTNGLFVVLIDFGMNVITGDARWLDISVRCPAGNGDYTTLNPRQALTPAPIALALPGLYTQPNADSPNVIGGYSGNVIDPNVVGGTIGGGGTYAYENKISADYATIGGGQKNTASGVVSTIGGGQTNTVSGEWATVGGGGNNTASGIDSIIGGGIRNIASGDESSIGGGRNNNAGGVFATVGGGGYNNASAFGATSSGGEHNDASGIGATVSGGEDNNASGDLATVAGGFNNSAGGSTSFAAGDRAKANHQGAFVWGDSTDSDFTSTANDQFLVRATGGVGINTNSPHASLDVNGSVRVELNDIYLREGSDTNHGLGYYGAGKPFASVPVDGPVLYGFSGGALGTVQAGVQNIALIWTPAGTVSIASLASSGSINICLNGLHQFASCSSSLRYKENISDLPLGLDTIAKLRPVTFDWKDSGQADLGFVAEEVDQVTPLLTTLNQEGQIEGVKYDRLTAVLVKAVQEQQQQIAELQAQVFTRQQEIAELKDGTATPEQSFNIYNLISVIALGGVIAIGMKQKLRGRR